MRSCLAALLGVCGTVHAQAPADFAWRGRLALPADASLVRVALPADALLHVQSADAADVRVFDGKGQPLPFAFAAPVDQPPPRQATSAFAALPLYDAQGAQPPRAGSVQVRIDEGGAQRSVWVQMTPGAEGKAGTRLPSALFDTRASKQEIDAITLKASYPANTPVRFTLSQSTDLAQWTPVPLRGRIYRFEGEGAPANDLLELQQPLDLEGRYLRLDWAGQEGVTVNAIHGVIVRPPRAPQQVTAPLPAPRADGTQALEWQLPFAMPLAALELGTAQPNTLVPVRVLGRRTASQPWRVLSNSVVYRIKGPEGAATNLAVVLPRESLRWLRVEATHGMRLAGLALTASAVFDPVELVFVAGGTGPYEIAAGRPDTKPAVLPLAMIAAATKTKVDELPLASVATASSAPAAPEPAWAGWLPQGVSSKAAVLWAVLLAGVAVLGAVAWSLLRQLGKAPPEEA